MIEIIRSTDERGRRDRLAQILSRSVSLDAGLMGAVGEIIDNVRRRGDAALVDYTAQFDGVRLNCDRLRVDEQTLRRSAERVDARVLEALREAIRRVRWFHERERADSWEMEGARGVRLGQRLSPIDAAGLYVPGGTASYPSSVVMNAVPAQVAGVGRIVVVTPPRTLAETPAVAAALLELGITEIYSVGGAQAVAALAYGTETIPRVDKITGPGNKYVAAAKKLVFGAVGIDSIAGPSEVVVLADDTARADFIAADLLAQSEHGEDASAVLITTSDALADAVAGEVARQAATLPRVDVVRSSLAQFGAIFVVRDVDEACAVANELAPEHLEIMMRDEESVAARVRHAGAIFFGAHTPEAVGDYFAGPNHVLPTGGASRFSSALGVHDFLRRTSIIRYTREELDATAHHIVALAQAEGLEAHARSAMIRIDAARRAMDDGQSNADKSLSAGLKSVPQAGDEQWATINRQSSVDKIKPRVRALRAYTLSTERGRVKINQNENPWDMPLSIKQETLRRLRERAWSRYPDFVPASLHEKLAAFAGWTPDGIVAGNGSNELIQATLMVTVREASRVLICEPTFALYRQVTTVLGGDIVSVPLTLELNFDVDAIIRAVETSRPDVTIICSPNNPTGCVLEMSDLEQLLLASHGGLVVVDEAYFEFAGHTVVPLLERHKNLVVFRTFSKAMAMAALRVGYLLAAPELAREISKAVLPYNLNAVSQTAAEVAVEMYETEMLPVVRKIVAERERLFNGLQNIVALRPVASHANFMVVESEIEPRRVYAELLERDILIRDVSSYPMLGKYFRVSVGTPEENDALMAALREIFTKGQRVGVGG